MTFLIIAILPFFCIGILGACFLGFGLGTCFTMITFANDLHAEVIGLDEKNESQAHSNRLIEAFTSFVQFHSIVKEYKNDTRF